MNRAALLVTLGVVLVLIGCTPAPATTSAGVDPDADDYAGTTVPRPFAMPAVVLTDTAGQPYDLLTSPSRPVTLMFFGYTHCRDVCVTVLSDVAMALGRLAAADRDRIQVLFVTTDPARDTPVRVRGYLDRFNTDFIGLTGTLTQIKTAGERMGVDIEGTSKLTDGGYAVSHSAQVIGFSRGRGVVLWEQGTSVGVLVHDFGLLVERSG